nr:NADH dehydrogenase subunit 5 [Aeschrocoris tuberculatus]
MCFYKFWSLNLFMFSVLMFLAGFFFLFNEFSLFFEWEILSLNSSSVVMSVYMDWMSSLFMGSVLFISSMVILYSSVYMGSDLFKIRFLYIVLLFVLSMMFLIISPNLISILLGWDGLGLVSYFLVIYYQNFKSYNAGMLTILTNRIGDVFILISIAWFLNLGGWNYIYYLVAVPEKLGCWLFIFIVVAAFTKSAQIPFSSWLPAAMAAPTPVSALVHSSTLVTAGVYLLIRFSDFLFLYNLNFFLLLSCLTMFMAGLGANFEYDLKKIIALSTLSQLGMMMSILFMGYSVLSYYHLLTHAFFKALMFLCAGLIIHCMNNSQDIRHMGYLINSIPFTCSCFCISSLSLCGMLFMSGFYSKDMILEMMTYNYMNIYIYVLFYLSVGLTVCYNLRLIYYCFSGSSSLSSIQSFDEDNIMLFSLIGLTCFSIFIGSSLMWLIIPFPYYMCFPIYLKVLPLIFIFLGGWLGYSISCLYLFDDLYGLKMNYSNHYMSSMWFMPSFSTYMTYNSSLLLSKKSLEFMDSSWGEYMISGSFPSLLNYFSSFYSNYQFNSFKIYLISYLFIFIVVLYL